MTETAPADPVPTTVAAALTCAPCGAGIELDQAFCESCGSPLGSAGPPGG